MRLFDVARGGEVLQNRLSNEALEPPLRRCILEGYRRRSSDDRTSSAKENQLATHNSPWRATFKYVWRGPANHRPMRGPNLGRSAGGGGRGVEGPPVADPTFVPPL